MLRPDNIVINEGVETIGKLAFDNLYKLKSVTVPGSVRSIGLAAFEYCSGMTNLELGFGIKNIGSSAFGNCYSLGSVTIPASVTNVGNSLFWSCREITNAVIGAGLSNIGNGMFFGCVKLTSMVIPDGVRDIGSNTFYNCASLTNVVLGNAVTNIGLKAFWNCSQLNSITIPASVMNVGTQAFAYCYALTNVFFAGNAPTNGANQFLFAPSIIYYLPNTIGWHSPFAGRPAVLWNPVIQTSGTGFGVQGNQFAFNITGTTNIPIVLEATTNLTDPTWVLLLNGKVTNGSIAFFDPLQGNNERFYRIRSP